MYSSKAEVLELEHVQEAIRRGVIRIDGSRITYKVGRARSENWDDPEEWVRAHSVAWLIVEKEYPAIRLKLEVTVPRRTPGDQADIVVYRDDKLKDPYLVVENKAANQTEAGREQGIEQAFGNANSLRAPLTLYDEGAESTLYDVTNYPAAERIENIKGTRDALPKQYDEAPIYTYISGGATDISPLPTRQIESKIRAAHSAIWAGGKRDPLLAFDEWSKLLFAKVNDERTPTGKPRRFQIGTNETASAVATRIHQLFAQACTTDPSIFKGSDRIHLSDEKILEVVRILQPIAFIRTDIDTIGGAFEQFFGSVFRGGLGQYFTMRPLARFTVALLEIDHEDTVLDPTAGSGGFLLEALLQVWHHIDRAFAGQEEREISRLKIDFALQHVYGIEIHEVLGRICKINLLLHHDGHTNIEANRSCLDSEFQNVRLKGHSEAFTKVIGNPPFGTEIKKSDSEQLGSNELEAFEIAKGLNKVDSDHVIVERSLDFLKPEGWLGLVVPDGMLNNQGARSNCPQVRSLIARRGKVRAIISLPDHAFRKSGAQNKTSILFVERYSRDEARRLNAAYERLRGRGKTEDEAIVQAVKQAGIDYPVFLGEANHVGYTPSGTPSALNDLYRAGARGVVEDCQDGTVLGEWRKFKRERTSYRGSQQPDCVALMFSDLWQAHGSRRLDPKYHLFKREEQRDTREGWVKRRLGDLMERRNEPADFSDPDAVFKVMTISQTGEIRAREAGKGRNYPEWRGSYFSDGPGTWYVARAGDLVYSSIDLWKGCIAVVPPEFDGALVTNEFPIYRIKGDALDTHFLQALLRSRYYQRAFRAITTGHSNRRRTQVPDFEALEIAFPVDRSVQEALIADIASAREGVRRSNQALRAAGMAFNDMIDGRGDEELPEVTMESEEAEAVV